MWTARPVFISSTFLDMQAERDYLRTRVFPELEEKLRARRHNLEWVDLRVGVATASQRNANARELHILKVCLAEVKRCRPFLIVLLGDRYGWAPPEDRVRAAAAEEGFAVDIAGRSITDLEIDFGVFSDPEQQPRSFFYFRDPLPYRDMPLEIAALFSNDYERDPNDSQKPVPGVADRTRRLAMLKQRIETLLPARVRHYAAQWDAEHKCVTGLKAFGEMVLEDIWVELENETRAAAAAADVPWQQVERNAIDDFAEDRARDFVGRRAIMARLTSFCLSPAQDGASWGICVTGDPGSGKSALFGALYRSQELETKERATRNRRRSSGGTLRLRESDVFLLAHAAGASVATASVDSMLRRWIDELAAALGIRDVGLVENADADTVEATFARLLHQMAAQRRIVVLVDALDQFESTTRGRFATWLPRPWPPNARLVATTIAGDASSTLAERPGIAALSLPPLDAAEAHGIIEGICKRYHRTFEPEVIDRLLAKTGPAGPAWGNPLWLVVAVEELNLLDADDFDRAQTYAGRPDEQLRTLMLEHIAKFPGDIPGLYGHTFGRAEKLFGASLARCFLGLIAVGRAGWRESDFRVLLPRVSGEIWDELRFAQLRRIFRGQMRRRGAPTRWDFNHAQMRSAVRRHFAGCGLSEVEYHSVIAEHLCSLYRDDPLRQSETMVHLLAAGNPRNAALYYGDDRLSVSELQGATQAILESVLSPKEKSAATAVQDAAGLLDVVDIEKPTRMLLVRRFLFDVSEAMSGHVPLELRAVVTNKVSFTLGALLQSDRVTATLLRLLLISRLQIANLEEQLGRHGRAIEIYQTVLPKLEMLTAEDPDYVQWLRDRQIAYMQLGDALRAALRHDEAVETYRKMLSVAEELRRKEADNARWPLQTCAAQLRIGATLLERGRIEEARDATRHGIEIAERFTTLDPTHLVWQDQLSAAQATMGDVLLAARQRKEALAEFHKLLVTSEKAAAQAPNNPLCQRQLAVSQGKYADALAEDDKPDEALTYYHGAAVIFETLLRADPYYARWQHDVMLTYSKIAGILVRHQRTAEAIQSFHACLAAAEKLAESDPGTWRHSLGLNYERMGDLLWQSGRPDQATEFYRKSLAIREELAFDKPTTNQISDASR
jgi:tetratricopeptide (TPR) repeat protein